MSDGGNDVVGETVVPVGDGEFIHPCILNDTNSEGFEYVIIRAETCIPIVYLSESFIFIKIYGKD